MTDKEAEQIAHGLIQGYIGPDHRVMNMPNSYGALLQALQATSADSDACDCSR